jgi:hypothetical protein
MLSFMAPTADGRGFIQCHAYALFQRLRRGGMRSVVLGANE